MKKQLIFSMLFIGSSVCAANPFSGSMKKGDVEKVCNAVANGRLLTMNR